MRFLVRSRNFLSFRSLPCASRNDAARRSTTSAGRLDTCATLAPHHANATNKGGKGRNPERLIAAKKQAAQKRKNSTTKAKGEKQKKGEKKIIHKHDSPTQHMNLPTATTGAAKKRRRRSDTFLDHSCDFSSRQNTARGLWHATQDKGAPPLSGGSIFFTSKDPKSLLSLGQ